MKVMYCFVTTALVGLSACDYELVPVDRNVPSEACQGEDIGPASTLSVRNFGEKDIPQTVGVAWFLSVDATLSPDDRLLKGGRDQIAGIGAESTVPVSINSNIIPLATAVGNYHLFTVVDEFDVVEEEDEDNNIVSSPITISACVACSGSVVAEGADERVKAIAAGPAGEIYVVGTRAETNSFANDNVDGFVRRLNPAGMATVWDIAVDNCYWDSVEDVAVAANGDVLIVGSTRPGPFASTESNYMVRRYSSMGTLLWQVSPDTPQGETGLGIAIDSSDDAAVITGAVSNTGVSALVARVSAAGVQEFATSVAPEPGAIGRAVAVDAHGKIAIVGDALSIGGTSPRLGWISQLSAVGSVVWSATQGSSTAASNDGVGVAVDSSGSVFALSWHRTTVGGTQFLPTLARYNASGILQWTQVIDFGRSLNKAADLVRESSGNLLITGTQATFTGSNPWLARYSPTGSELFLRSLTPNISLVTGLAINHLGSQAYVAAQSSTSANQTRVIEELL